MPVLGHAFVGLATASCVKPVKATALCHVFRMPVLVGLAYFPDIVGWSATTLHVPDARIASHSILFAAVSACILAFPLARLFGMGIRRAFGIAMFSILSHIALDLFQASDRIPWWPFWIRPVGLGLHMVPGGSLAELGWFAAGLGVFLLVRWAFRRRSPSSGEVPVAKAAADRRSQRLGDLLVAAVLLLATITHYLRSVREADHTLAREALTRGRYRQVLLAADRARRWPSTAKPGRLDYLKAEAYIGLGDRLAAERHYLDCIRADPAYFWAIADLAAFYASSDKPATRRRRQAIPYIRMLRARFPTHKALERTLDKLHRKLGDAPP